MLLEPLKRLKQADSRLNMTQGVLEGVGMWSLEYGVSIISVLLLLEDLLCNVYVLNVLIGCWRRACGTSRNGFYLFDTSTREIRWVLRYYGPKGPER